MPRIQDSLVLILAAGMTSAGCQSKDEVARVTAPTGDVDGVVVETNGGATSSFGYDIHVLERGRAVASSSRVAFLYGAVRSESAYGVNLRWDSASTLSIEYWAAKSAELSSPSLPVGARLVTVVLKPGVRDESAPPGGMLFNLRIPRKR